METAKQKRPSSGAYYIRIVGTLFVITTVVAILLAAVNMLTAPTIAKLAAEKEAKAMEAVMPECQFTAVEDKDLPQGIDGITEMQLAESGEAGKGGYCVKVEVNGFGGAMELMVGVDANDTVTGVSILSHGETLHTDEHDWLIEQYPGHSGTIGVAKKASDSDIQAISGATVTSKAVTKGVNNALAAVSAYKETHPDAQGGAK